MASTKIDDLSYKKLVLVKQIFDRSVNQTSLNYAERLLILIGYDLANETALKTVISSLSTKPFKDRNFSDIVKEAESVLSVKGLRPVPDEANIWNVRNRRNSSQHDARNPSDSDLAEAQIYTRDFLEKLCKQVWDLDFHSISMRSLIQNSEVKKLLDVAYAFFEKGDFSSAACDAVVAFQHVKGMIKRFAVGRESQGVILTFTTTEDQAPLSHLADDINNLRDVVFHSLLGVDFKEYLRFERISLAFGVHYLGGMKYKCVQYGEDFTEEEAEFALQFVTNATVAAENLAGELERPFGIDPTQRPYI